MLDLMFKSSDARQAPIYARPFGPGSDIYVSPFNIDVWICAGCLKMAPAVGLQATFRPTDWELVEAEGGGFLLCPECKEED